MESLERWRVAMGVEEMVLCGHSLGGMMAAAYAMAHPGRLVRSAILLCALAIAVFIAAGEGGLCPALLRVVAAVLVSLTAGLLCSCLPGV